MDGIPTLDYGRPNIPLWVFIKAASPLPAGSRGHFLPRVDIFPLLPYTLKKSFLELVPFIVWRLNGKINR